MKTISRKFILPLYLFLTFFAFLCSIFSLYVSNNYNKIYNIPKINNCVLNLNDYDINTRKVDYLLNGSWEFYYNQWIVSDNEENKCLGTISLPSHWNDCFDISPNGYASYKLKITNVSNANLSIVLNNFRYSYRAFINGELVVSSGNMSKDKVAPTTGKIDIKRPYEIKNDKKDIDLILEISYNTVGGFYSAPWLTTSSFSDNTNILSNTITTIIILMSGALICLTLILFGLYKGIKKYGYSCLSDFIICLFLMFNQLTSKDGALIFNKLGIFNYQILASFCFLFLLLVFILTFKKKKDNNIHYFFLVISFLLIALFSFTKWNIIFISLFFIDILFITIYYCFKGKIYFQFPFICLLTFFEFFDYLGFFVFGSECLISLVLFLILLLNTFEILNNINYLAKNNPEIKKAQNKMLVNQIQPHFIFNTLTSIQNLYDEKNENASLAMNEFAKHLRWQIDSINNELVTFEEELDNIFNFINLYSLSKNFNVDVLYDIDYIDFSIPSFSLQPFIENCLKHAGLNEKDNGQIIISTKKENKQIIISINDNGCGFDISKISDKSNGIRNCIERLKYTLNASVDIDSFISKGTNITIKFMDKRNEKNNTSR